MSGIRSGWTRDWWLPLVEAIYPAKCRLCAAWAEDDWACSKHVLPSGLEGPRCDRCAARLPPALPDGSRCALCRRKRPAFRRVVALGDYESGELREWLLALKHGHRRDIAEPLGQLLGEQFAKSGGSGDDLLVPVPLHFMRRFERGYDQAWLLAIAAAEASGASVLQALRRTRSTTPQGSEGAVSRSANVRAAFEGKRRVDDLLAGRTVWLVDDVLTSGATAAECTRVLRRLGAETAGVLVVARAGAESLKRAGF